MRGEQFYRSQKKETSSLSQEDENSRVENLSTLILHKIFNRPKQKKISSPQKRTYPLVSRSSVPNRRTIKQKWRTSILFHFHSTPRLSSARECEGTRKSGKKSVHVRRGMTVERGNVHFRGNYTEASGQ